MPVDKIIERIKEDVNRKVENILEREKERAEDARKEIEKEKNRKLDEIRNKREREIKTMKNRILSQAKLKRQKKKLSVREEMMEKAFDEAKNRLKEMNPSEYEDYLRQSIGKATDVLEGDVTILCNPESEEKVKELAEKIKPSLKVKSGLETIGGIKAESEGSRIDFTFEANLERKKKEIRKEIADILFPEEE